MEGHYIRNEENNDVVAWGVIIETGVVLLLLAMCSAVWTQEQ